MKALAAQGSVNGKQLIKQIPHVVLALPVQKEFWREIIVLIDISAFDDHYSPPQNMIMHSDDHSTLGVLSKD